MVRRRVLPFIVFVFVSALAMAGEHRAIPTLVVEGDDGNVALDLVALRINVTIRGHLARTEYDLTYRNSMDHVVGGDFHFPLPPDAEVSDLGLWFDGKLRHGVAVERTLARTAYEETVHRSVDPALAEWTAGRGFRLRVFPIPENGEKQVYIAYDQELTNGDYVLDLRYGKPMRFQLTIDADRRAIGVEGNVPFNTKNEVIDGVVRVAREPGETTLVGRADGKWYASIALDLDAQPAQMPPAAHVVILYDTSSSSLQQNGALVRRFLTEFLARQQAWASAIIVPFHIALDPPRRVERAGTIAGQREVERVLGELQPLGATNLMAVASELASSLGTLPAATRVVLVTDGLSSLGSSREVSAAFAKLAGTRRPLLLVNASPNADDQLLANAARATGGWSIDLTRTDPDIAAASAMRKPVSKKFDGADVFPSSVVANAAARVIVNWRADSPAGLGRSGRELYDTREVGMVRRAWARAKLREMIAHGAPDEALIAHGRAFTQLTPRTSLLVLESWWDYERYGIEMPPELAAEKAREIEEARRKRELMEQPVPAVITPPAAAEPGVWCIRGTVFIADDGVVLPGATVTLRDGATVLQTDVTDAEGRFAFFQTPPPEFPALAAELAGLHGTSYAFPGPVLSGTTMQLSMRVAAVSESITVTASSPTIEVNRAASATTTRLLDTIAQDASFVADDPEVRAQVAKQRRELTREVVVKLRTINSTSERIRYYLSARALLGGDKSFHVFAAEAFRERSPEVAARILSELAEVRAEDAPMLRILARVLDGWGETELARLLLRRAIDVSAAEPQSWRELLLLEARHGRRAEVEELAKKMRAMKNDAWDIREIYQQTDEALARWERASILARERGADIRRDENNDLTIELMWDTDWCWVDIHIVEPDGEIVKWDHTKGTSGATFTGGYIFGFGPQIYTLPKAARGEYRVEMDYYASDETNVSLETLAHVVVYRHGRRSDHFAVLSNDKEHYTLVTIPMD